MLRLTRTRANVFINHSALFAKSFRSIQTQAPSSAQSARSTVSNNDRSIAPPTEQKLDPTTDVTKPKSIRRTSAMRDSRRLARLAAVACKHDWHIFRLREELQNTTTMFERETQEMRTTIRFNDFVYMAILGVFAYEVFTNQRRRMTDLERLRRVARAQSLQHERLICSFSCLELLQLFLWHPALVGRKSNSASCFHLLKIIRLRACSRR